jgi:D-alanine transaminase
MPELASVNGVVTPIEEATVPIEDRGYQFGDAVYEVIASYGGRLLAFEAHLQRLTRSMKALAFAPMPLDSLRGAVVGLFERAEIARAAVYLQVSRGVAPRNHAYGAAMDPQIVITVREVVEKPAELRERGAAVITVPDERWQRCDIKTVQLVPNAMAKQKALDAGAFDAIFISREGEVREGTSSNLFAVRDGCLITHPLTPNILPGITRRLVLDICRRERLTVEERIFLEDDLFAADEVFLCGTITEVLPVAAVDGQPIGDGGAGAITKRLYDGLLALAVGTG